MRFAITRGECMKIGIVLNTNDAETCWNCFRFGNEAIKGGHTLKIFLLGKGVEVEDVNDVKFQLLKVQSRNLSMMADVFLPAEHALHQETRKEARYALYQQWESFSSWLRNQTSFSRSADGIVHCRCKVNLAWRYVL